MAIVNFADRADLLDAVKQCIASGNSTGAYIYARMLGRAYYRHWVNQAWSEAARGGFTPNRPTIYMAKSKAMLEYPKPLKRLYF